MINLKANARFPLTVLKLCCQWKKQNFPRKSWARSFNFVVEISFRTCKIEYISVSQIISNPFEWHRNQEIHKSPTHFCSFFVFPNKLGPWNLIKMLICTITFLRFRLNECHFPNFRTKLANYPSKNAQSTCNAKLSTRSKQFIRKWRVTIFPIPGEMT